jgi:cytochrome P450 PksS
MSVDLTAPQARRNPYAIYQQLRDHEPLSTIRQPFGGDAYFLTRYDDVTRVLKDRRFANDSRKRGTAGRHPSEAWWMPRVFRSLLNSMVMMDDPDHRRLRDLVHKAFTPRRVEQMAGRIEAISHDLLDALAGQPVVDLVAGFAMPLPLTVISEMMGVPPADRFRFQKWSVQFIDSTSGLSWRTLLNIPNAFAMQRFFQELITLRRRHPADDLITALVEAEDHGDRLSEDELVAMLLLLLLAGHETTVNLIGSGTLALLQHPDQLHKLQANPALMTSAIEELLRFTNPVQQIAPRYALESVELHGRVIPKGSTVMLGLAAANWDERVFSNPDQLDITREPNRHVAFGLGTHFCLGAPLARLEGRIALRVLLDRFPHLQLAVPPAAIQWRTAVALRGLKALPVRLA